ncbi:MurR/RpiR family transcriptional regulator [Szabonella alba]|uniref:MurR/RpiR family transcriptional regulator n=1 Tax=Szabonella alba TaxID=2804194 RepID=A0A8K0VB60_9RHOB|nr:MurR/RpiR family transcriptional regulator [Szabonella alba]MBL4918984.1 MurR/RpiR family transcriptional regulator [Szabonella alba]
MYFIFQLLRDRNTVESDSIPMVTEQMNDPMAHLAQALPDLPTKLAQAARFMIDNPNQVALDSMRSVSVACGVTSPTMVRLARKIGYDSYDELRADFQKQLLEQGFGPRVAALRASLADEGGGKAGPQIAEVAVRNLKQAQSHLDPAAVVLCAEAIIRAERTFVIGTGSMYWMAGLLKSVAGIAVPGTILTLSGDQTASELVADVGPGDVVLALSFAPYSRQTIEAVAFAKARNAPVFAVTDRRSSPLAALASTVFLAPTDSPHYYPSLVAAFYIVENLLTAIASSRGTATKDRLKAVDDARRLSGAYIF